MCVREGWFDVWVQAPVAKTTLPDNLGMLHVQMWLGCLSEGRCLKLNLGASELQAPYVCYKWYDEGCAIHKNWQWLIETLNYIICFYWFRLFGRLEPEFIIELLIILNGTNTNNKIEKYIKKIFLTKKCYLLFQLQTVTLISARYFLYLIAWLIDWETQI